MLLNWKSRSFVATARFMFTDRLLRMIDKRLGRPSREQRLLAFVRASARPGDAEAVLGAMDLFATTQRFLMNIGPIKGAVLRDALLHARPRRVLEIGAYCGYSAVLIGATLAATSNAPGDGKLLSIERSRRFAKVAAGVIAHAGLGDTVDLHNGTLSDFIAQFTEPFDLVFLDHWKDEYLPDLERLESAGLLRAGTVVVADNIGFFTVPDYLEHVRNGGRYDSRCVQASVEYHPELHDAVEVSIFRG